MPQNQEAAARQAFADAVGLWRTSPGAALAEVVGAAVELLVAGVDTPSLRELAGAAPTDSIWTVEPLLVATIEELGAPELLEGSAERASLLAMLRQFLAERISVRELSSWAHSAIGHEGEPALQPFVELDDVLDELEMQRVASQT